MKPGISIAGKAGWIAFWAVAGLFYVLYFGRSAARYADVLHLALPLLAVAMATSWVVGSWLMPRYLLTGRYALFALFLAYTLVIAAFLVLAIIVGAFMLVAGYETRNLAPAALDRAGLFVGVCIVVAVAMVIHLVGHWNTLRASQAALHREKEAARSQLERTEAELSEARRRLEAGGPEVLELQVDRRTVRVPIDAVRYLESAGDYVVVSTDSGRLITKARLSDLSDRLGDSRFLRVHRGFVIRIGAVDAFSGSEVVVDSVTIPVGRTYRGAVRNALEATRTSRGA